MSTKENYKDLSILERMLEIENEVGHIQKNITLTAGKETYKAVSEVDVKRALRPLEYKWGVKSTPIKFEVVDSREQERESYNGKVRIEQFIRVKVAVEIACIDKPEQRIVVEGIGDGVDTQDKASGKAQTYAVKYALMNAYKLITGDDPDHQASEVSQKPKKDPKLDAKKLYAHALEHFGNDKELTEKTLKEFLKKGYNADSLATFDFAKHPLKDVLDSFDDYVDLTNRAQEQMEDLGV